MLLVSFCFSTLAHLGSPRSYPSCRRAKSVSILGICYLSKRYLNRAVKVSWHLPYYQKTSEVLSVPRLEPRTCVSARFLKG